MSANSGTRRRVLWYVLIVLASIGGAAGYVLHVVARNQAAAAAAPAIEMVRVGALSAGPPPPASRLGNPGVLMFRSTALGESFGMLSMADADRPAEPRRVGPLRCDRLHFAAGVGLCLETRRSALVSYHAHVFNDKFAVTSSFSLVGPPSRARVSRDGRLAAFTVFASGHSYDNPGFTTRTTIVDTQRGKEVVADLESLSVQRGGDRFKAVDFNFWGVTFAADANTFYATLGTGGKLYLVRGDLRAGTMRVIHDDVECPSLSPDGTRVAFKRRAPMDSAGRRIWRLVVLDLASGRETLLTPETRNVDDQVEWLNDQQILYALPKTDQQATATTDVWALAADGTQAPRLLLPFAFSPAALR